jgi:myosin heavy subunit
MGARRFLEKDAFIVRHFASDVCYQTKGWMSKNNDATHDDLAAIMKVALILNTKMLFEMQ